MLSPISKIIRSNNYHLVNNFPNNFSIFGRALSNIAFFILTTKITRRKNFLTQDDFVLATKMLQKGDVILVGDFRRISSFFTGKFFTHALLYAGKNKCIHASVDGVNTILFEKLFEEYDTLLIMRPQIKHNFKQTINNVIACASKKIGMAYNFYFEYRQDRYICTQLIETSFQESGVSINIGTKHQTKENRFRIFSRIHRIIRADDFLKGDFKIFFVSKEIEKQEYFMGKEKRTTQPILRASL
ncbi:MAG TPA: YiiX/YebB-like N1pC/P60 family cysteine hydrolase [Candidatus Saccharimonadales bacterium]|nr:YiiX/YebB-like N1pC/P60 family cysteine hydrolase [Candidatus Saccharimonadales bacterium]